MSFVINDFSDLLNYHKPMAKFNNDLLKLDKIMFVKKNLDLLLFYLCDYEHSKDKNQIKYIIFSIFADCCRTLEISTSISDIIDEIFVESIKISNEIDSKVKFINDKIDFNSAKDAFKRLRCSLEKELFSSFCFTLSDMECRENFNVKAYFNSEGYCLCCYNNDDIPDISENKLRSIFDCTDGTFSDETIRIKATDENMKKIVDISNRIFKDAKIINVSSDYLDSQDCFCINNVTISINNY